MLVCVVTTQVSAWTTHEVKSSCEKQESTPVFKQLTQETVVPHHDFSFGEINSFFQENGAYVFPEKCSGSSLGMPAPPNTYMAKLLEHHIAINAP